MSENEEHIGSCLAFLHCVFSKIHSKMMNRLGGGGQVGRMVLGGGEGGRGEPVMSCCDSLANRQQCTVAKEQCSVMIVFVQCIMMHLVQCDTISIDIV